jgi:D-alanyl-D-alanine carboxypeptidase/D-alanyl-D-alanine-endopeptidase (penicillin-binding protein 4)
MSAVRDGASERRRSAPPRRSRTRLAALILGLFLAGCHGTRPVVVPAPPRNPLRQLQLNIDTLLQEPALAPGTWGVLVQSLSRNDTLYAVNPHKLMLPSSNLKVFTLAAAAERLGWDYTYETAVAATAGIESGRIDGDLIVSGSGDPSLSESNELGPRLFELWAERLKTLGVATISGRIIGDDHAFDNETLGAGWMWDDLNEGYSAGIGALQVDQNVTSLTVSPGSVVGSAAVALFAAEGTGLTVRNRATTGPPDSPPSVRVHRPAFSAMIELGGSIPLDAKPIKRAVPVDNPTLYFVSELRRVLIASGIEVRGAAIDIDDLPETPLTGDRLPLLVHRSPPLSTLAERLMKFSQNQYAETLLKTLGAAAGQPTFEGGRVAVRQVAESWGVAPGDLVLADGSGLSRYNLVTPQALVTVLAHVDRDERLKEPFEATLPIAGRDGTLAGRLKGTPADGNVRAKTGSFSNARSVAGYARTADGEPIVFAIIANNFGIPAAVIDRVTDDIITHIVQFRR